MLKKKRAPPDGIVLIHNQRKNRKHILAKDMSERKLHMKFDESKYTAKKVIKYIETENCNRKTAHYIIAEYFINVRQLVKNSKRPEVTEDAKRLILYCIEGRIGKEEIARRGDELKLLRSNARKFARALCRYQRNEEKQRVAYEIMDTIDTGRDGVEQKDLLMAVLNNWDTLKNRVYTYDVLAAAVMYCEPEATEYGKPYWKVKNK